MTDITITDSAQTYLNGLLEKQNVEGMGVRLFVSQPGTMYAETCLAYCRPGEEKPEDERVACDGFTAYLDQPSLPYLDEAVVDYVADKLGGQLTIKAPKAKQPAVAFDGPIEQQIVEILTGEVNPGLAAHGGEVRLIRLEEDVAILQFGGGCQVELSRFTEIGQNIHLIIQHQVQLHHIHQLLHKKILQWYCPF